MSTFLSQAKVRTLRPNGALPRPRLTIVPKVAARAPRIPFAVLVVTVLGAGLIGLLLLNTSLQRGAYAVTALQDTSQRLTLEQQNLQTQVASLQSPQRISERALRLGMVAGDSPAFLSIETGKVVGVPVAGKRAQRPTLGITATRHAGPATKVPMLVSGEAASQTTGVVKVPKPQQSRPGSSRPGSTKASDTRTTSPDRSASSDTKNQQQH